VPRAVSGTGHVTDMVMRNLSFLPSPSGLEKAEQALRELFDVWREAGRGEVESKDYANSRVPEFQARVPAQHEYRHAEQQRHRQCHRQSITFSPCATSPQDRSPC
jgi:hypothetical protein